MVGETCSTPQPPKLLDQVRDRLRVKHYSAPKGSETFPVFSLKIDPSCCGRLEKLAKSRKLR